MAYDRLVRKLTKENLWLYVISVLRDRPLYGYAVKKAIAEKFKFNPSTITVYAVLYRMSREGLIEKFSDGETTYYRTTVKGLTLFNRARNFIKEIEKLIFE